MTFIWGTNYSIVKHAFAELDPQAFNAARMLLASSVFLAVIAGMRWRAPRAVGMRWRVPHATGMRWRVPHAPAAGAASDLTSIFYTPASLTRRDWLGLAGLGIVGQCFYQYFFVGGLAQTSVANSALMVAATPVLIALLSAALGQDRIGRWHWLGAALSLGGIYLVVGQAGQGAESSSLRGDLMMFAAVCCWAIYTLGARPLMRHHSPVGVTGLSMAIGTALYVPVVFPHLRAVDWTTVSRGTWIALVYSALFALCVAYTIWYAAVREIGNARTSVYSNLVPVVALLTAVIFLHEPLGGRKLAGAAAVLIGVALTRLGRQGTMSVQ